GLGIKLHVQFGNDEKLRAAEFGRMVELEVFNGDHGREQAGVKAADFHIHARLRANLMLGDHAQNGVLENEQQDHRDDEQRDEPKSPFKKTLHDLRFTIG